MVEFLARLHRIVVGGEGWYAAGQALKGELEKRWPELAASLGALLGGLMEGLSWTALAVLAFGAFVLMRLHQQTVARPGLPNATAEPEPLALVSAPAPSRPDIAELTLRLDAFEGRLADAEAAAREQSHLYEVAERLGRKQADHERAFEEHSEKFKEFARWSNERLSRLEGLVIRAEQRKRLNEYGGIISRLKSEVKDNETVFSTSAIDRLRITAQKIESLFEVRGIRGELDQILELWDRDLRAGRIEEDAAHWILWQKQLESLEQALAGLKQDSATKDYETVEALLTHR
jgi:hypothetical protein